MTKILAIPGEGERLDRFELVAELAAGGMATVYLARFIGVAGFKRFVAIKRLHPHLAKEQDFIQMFLDEARLASRLHHPNVVPILEIGMQNEQYYLVMEYIEGDTVGHLMARAANVNRKIPVPVVIRVMLDTLTGLHAAHELTDDDGAKLEIVHRDVSPQNILVGVDGVARITDFGVAKAQARLANATQGGQLKGKLAYMSPEQVRGNMTVDRRADVFAAGIVLWELFTAQRLFKAEGEAETLFKVVAAEVPPVRNFEPSVPPEVEVVLRRALAAHPQDRFETAADFAEALEQAARTYNLVATVRTAAAFVNEMIGMDISQQREIVRAWLGRSDVSRSGIARSLNQIEAATPLVGSPKAETTEEATTEEKAAAPAAAPQLSSLVDDDLEMATRIDDPDMDDEEEPATRIQAMIEPVSSPRPAPVAPNSQPVLSMGAARDQYHSVATSREFQPMAAANPALANTMNAPTSTAFTPPGLPPNAGASGPYPPAPVAFPWPPQQAVQPAPKKTGIPTWTLIIPALIIIGGAVLLGLRQSAPPPTRAKPPPTTATSMTTTAPTDTATAATPPATATYVPTATATIAPIPTMDVNENAPHATTHTTTTTTHTHFVPTPAGGGTNAAAVDNHEFGGRK
jgi:serine/threonine-protein kinase